MPFNTLPHSPAWLGLTWDLLVVRNRHLPTHLLESKDGVSVGGVLPLRWVLAKPKDGAKPSTAVQAQAPWGVRLADMSCHSPC